MKALILFVGWCVLLALCWPLALLALVLFPAVWLFVDAIATCRYHDRSDIPRLVRALAVLSFPPVCSVGDEAGVTPDETHRSLPVACSARAMTPAQTDSRSTPRRQEERKFL